jgi:hypothetical protein
MGADMSTGSFGKCDRTSWQIPSPARCRLACDNRGRNLIAGHKARLAATDRPAQVVVDDSAHRVAPEPPPGVKSMPDRAAPAAKVARVRGVDPPAEAPAQLSNDESQFSDQQVETSTARRAKPQCCRGKPARSSPNRASAALRR